ncbi:MAG: 23S rRNA (adenine(2503)-C(2))-methyltransferase RlmN [Bacilli bacterium]|nr:23S rRNA (adenine(2503)-C(2))-methyltransferase RlmN [Bacilli bacterium]
MKNIFEFSREKLEEDLLSKGISKYRSQQIFDWIYKKNVLDVEKMQNISKIDIEIIKNEYSFEKMKVVDVKESSDRTKKFLFELNDGNYIETVLMNFSYGKSICISTQVGCDMGCSFCASGKDKKVRDLTVAEMVLQVVQVKDSLVEGENLTNIVIMGIGEPFDNYINLIDFIKIVNDNKGINIGARHITVSTCGLVPQILEFANLPLQVNLAISLHFANDEKRSKYMKINKAYNLEKLFNALEIYYNKTNRRITFEYLLIKEVNDSLTDAKQLVSLIKGLNAYVNLIPYNDTQMFSRSPKEAQNRFYDYLMKNRINVTLRREQGLDISAACGQLRIKKMRDDYGKRVDN